MNTIFNALESENIKLRALEPKDIDIIYNWENDPEIWEISETIAPFSKALLQQYLENIHLDIYQTRQLRLMIDRKSDKDAEKSIGTVDLFDFDPFHNRIGLGVLIKDEENRKQGYAKESLQLIIEYIFTKLMIHQIFCNIPADNQPSINLFQKFGFEITGEKKEWIKTPSGWKNEYLLQLINPHGH